MHVFFSRDISDITIALDESESKHAASVLRVSTGDTALVLDGMGHVFESVFVEVHSKRSSLRITGTQSQPRRKVSLHVAIAPTKMNDRMEWFLEKATEVGIEQVTPIICNRSERRIVNVERFRKVVLAAIKQSKQPWLPEVNEAVTLENFIKTNPPGLIAHCIHEKVRQPFVDAIQGIQNVSILIGPEGDFTPKEVEMAETAGWKPVALGESRLRTETAGLVACVAVALPTS